MSFEKNGDEWKTTEIKYSFVVKGKTVSGKLNDVEEIKAKTGYSYACARTETFESKDVKFEFSHFKLEPSPTSKDGSFDKQIECPDEKPSSMVPVAVGCALAGLGLIVLIVYIVMRRRDKSVPYENV